MSIPHTCCCRSNALCPHLTCKGLAERDPLLDYIAHRNIQSGNRCYTACNIFFLSFTHSVTLYFICSFSSSCLLACTHWLVRMLAIVHLFHSLFLLLFCSFLVNYFFYLLLSLVVFFSLDIFILPSELREFMFI